MQGEAEYAFWHILSRDVAYSQLPRASRAARHVAAAAWIESQAPDRVEDLADVLAYHYATALELARAAGQTDQVRDAGGAGAAIPHPRGRTRTWPRHGGGHSPTWSGRWHSLPWATPTAHTCWSASPRPPSTADAPARRERRWRRRSRPCRRSADLHGAGPCHEHAQCRARALVGDPRWAELPSPGVRTAGTTPARRGTWSQRSREVAATEMLQGRSESAIAVGRRALRLAEELGLDRPPRALGYLGSSRMDIGDAAGADDMRDAILLANQAGQGREVAILHNNLSVGLWAFEGPEAALAELDTGVAYATARGLTEMAEWATTSTLSPRFDTGRAGRRRSPSRPRSPNDSTATRPPWSRFEASRRASTRSAASRPSQRSYLEWLETTARDTGSRGNPGRSGWDQPPSPTRTSETSRHATALLSELAAAPDIRDNSMYAAYLPALVRTALRTRGARPRPQPHRKDYQPQHSVRAPRARSPADAALAEDRGDHQAAADGYADAAGRWERFGVVPEHAYALLGHGRCLISLGQPHEAAPALHQARALFDRLGAIPALAETDDLLARATALSS